jgi:hypothetical protein
VWLVAVSVDVSSAKLHRAVVSVPSSEPSTENSTLVMPTPSVARACTWTVPVSEAPLAGDAIATVGRVVSTGAGRVTITDAVAVFPASLRAVAVSGATRCSRPSRSR